MRLDFRQGIITYPTSSNQQVFLAKVGSYVNLQTANGRTDVAFAYGTEDYILSEASDVQSAWGPLLPNVDYWVYWDLDLLTAVKTYGTTTLAPQVSSIQPNGVNNLHWFNLVDNKMYVYNLGAWRAVLRVFAARVNNSIFTAIGIGIPSKPFAGTQVGLTTPNTLAGRIAVDDNGLPIRKSNGTFFTSEDDFFVNGSPVNALRPESSIFNATAQQSIAKYQVVKFTYFGKLMLASYDNLQTNLIALSLEDMAVNESRTICIQGVVNNPLWNWQTVGAQLWVSGDILTLGELTDVDPHLSDPIAHSVAKVAVARVLSPTSIYFNQGLGGKGDKGEIGSSTLPYDLAFYMPYALLDTNTAISGFLSPRNIIITTGGLNIAKCSIVAVTSDTIFNIKVNGVTYATVTFTVGQALGSIIFTPGPIISITSGDEITLCTTSTMDTTIAGVGITLVGVSSII